MGDSTPNQHRKIQNSTWPTEILMKFHDVQSFIEMSYHAKF
jgi:hypothetical protein